MQAEVTGKSRFWSVANAHPEPNADTKRLLDAYKYLPHTFTSHAWTAGETRALEGAVLQVVQASASAADYINAHVSFV